MRGGGGEGGRDEGGRELTNTRTSHTAVIPVLVVDIVVVLTIIRHRCMLFLTRKPRQNQAKIVRGGDAEAGRGKEAAGDRGQRRRRRRKEKKGGLRLRERSSNFTSNTPQSRVQTMPNITQRGKNHSLSLGQKSMRS